ncbi:MAG: hypothetical protein OEQ25_01420 [Gammaproteobacteria bacterium]|nr:hypothetical protein [Gammaproteobacteria bacterium]MDH3505774.1 hypothetical protein [Gammaproteobacteria bacterium]
MPYAYFARLSRANKAIYRQSDAIDRIALKDAASLRPLVRQLEKALALENRASVEAAVRPLCDALIADVGAATLTIKVLATRPSHDWGELHGLYEPAEGRRRARLTVWMRTAQHKKVVAFRTFLRTILHEICHHLDYEVLGLDDSFHTEGFFKRESSLFHQLIPATSR